MKNKLQTAQNKMIRYLLNYGCRRHIGFNDFKKSNFLDINARVDYMSLNMMFNIFNNVAPSYTGADPEGGPRGPDPPPFSTTLILK